MIQMKTPEIARFGAARSDDWHLTLLLRLAGPPIITDHGKTGQRPRPRVARLLRKGQRAGRCSGQTGGKGAKGENRHCPPFFLESAPEAPARCAPAARAWLYGENHSKVRLAGHHPRRRPG